MNAIPTPDPLPLPSPPSLLWALLMITFIVHVVAMNFVLGGSIIAAVTRFRRSEEGDRLTHGLSKMLPTLVAAAITFGVAPLLFLQTLYGRLFFSSAVLMGWIWLSIVPLLIFAYYGTYASAFRRVAIAVPVAVALLFIAISFIQSNNMTLMLRPDRFLPMYFESARGLHLNSGDSTLIPRWLHMLFGAIAVAGLGVAGFGVAKDDAWSVRYGALWFAGATMLNVVTGMWWLGALPGAVVTRFMGQNPLATTWLALGILLGFAALTLMLMALAGREPGRLVKLSSWLTLGTVVMMLLARDEVRRGMLELAQFRMTAWIEPQWDVIGIFAVLLVGAVAVTAWMGSLLLTRRPLTR
jgi:hypothetical protein